MTHSIKLVELNYETRRQKKNERCKTTKLKTSKRERKWLNKTAFKKDNKSK